VLGEVAEGVSLGTAIERIRRLYGVARSEEEREIFDWHLANLEYANAGCLSDLSWAHWDQDDPYEMDGDHCFLAGGNWRLINALCEDVPILYGKKVMRIKYGDSGVEVVVEGGQAFHADMVLCTVPLGVLKSGSIKFDPALPSRKVEAIERLGFGLLNKVAMVFPHVFWEEGLDTFGCLNKDSSERGEFFLFYSYHTVSGGAVLIALVAGEATLTFERMDPVALLHRVLEVLRGINLVMLVNLDLAFTCIYGYHILEQSISLLMFTTFKFKYASCAFLTCTSFVAVEVTDTSSLIFYIFSSFMQIKFTLT